MAENENKSSKKLEEANFEVSSLAEVKDENGNGIFHLRTKTKFILAISILILLAAGALLYLFAENYIVAEIWQAVLWGLCGVLAIYSIFARSILAMLLNLILFVGVSFIPTWQSGYETFRPMIEKFSSEPKESSEPATVEPPMIETPSVEEKSEPIEVKPAEEKISELEKNSADEQPADSNSQEKNLPARENNLRQDLPSV